MSEERAYANIETAAGLIEGQRPVMARTLRDMLRQFDGPEPPYAKTPAEAFDSIMKSADAALEDVASERIQVGLVSVASTVPDGVSEDPAQPTPDPEGKEAGER